MKTNPKPTPHPKALAYHQKRRNFGYAILLILESLIFLTIIHNWSTFQQNPQNFLLYLLLSQLFILILFVNTFLNYHRITKQFQGIVLNFQQTGRRFQEEEPYRIIIKIQSTQPNPPPPQTHTLFASTNHKKAKKIFTHLQPYYRYATVVKHPGMRFPQNIAPNPVPTQVCLFCGTLNKPAFTQCAKCKLPPLTKKPRQTSPKPQNQ